VIARAGSTAPIFGVGGAKGLRKRRPRGGLPRIFDYCLRTARRPLNSRAIFAPQGICLLQGGVHARIPKHAPPLRAGKNGNSVALHYVISRNLFPTAIQFPHLPKAKADPRPKP